MTKVIETSVLVKNGWLHLPTDLPEGLECKVTIEAEVAEEEDVWASMTPEERAELKEEFAFWERASASSGAMIDEWERQEGAPSFEELMKPDDKR